jgi:predicted small metal-binding protein
VAAEEARGASVVRLRASCECGWEIVGGEDEVVAATMDHGQRIHNMPASREAVLQAAERLGPHDA